MTISTVNFNCPHLLKYSTGHKEKPKNGSNFAETAVDEYCDRVLGSVGWNCYGTRG
ncbi:hypothetical protein [Coleofasciculus chthonoplastes]|uniref:hypothetical protein n=1 Tax=Coleofasciculus TaxID=669368 RepID=UPI0032F2FE7D